MAGKKRSSVVDTGVQSKTAKRSLGKKKEEGFLASSDLDRIIPLCGGEWCYLLDPRDGKTHHIRVGSERWTAVITDLVADPKHGSKIHSQIEKLGWSAISYENPCWDIADND